MKKAVSVLICAALIICSVFAMAGCTKQDTITNDIVLITDGNDINDSGCNQSTWEGISSFASENGMTCRYYQPVLDENDEITSQNTEKYVDLAAKNGAQYIVFAGEAFAVVAYEIAPSYPEVKFILLDAVPHSADDTTDRYIENVMSVKFDALQSGYLAGYIAVASGNTKLGYFGEFGSSDSASYGAGFAQGAAYAADTLGVPVTLDWADYDSPLLDYSYDFTLTACYDKIEDSSEDTFTVKVENGTGDGTYTQGTNVTVTADPAPEGKTFDKWEVKSDTSGVKDKKVNVSSKTDASMNLIVEKCDCTITATYKEIEGSYYSVKLLGTDGQSVYSEQSVEENSSTEVTAPVAEANMVFDHWESNVDGAVEDEKSKTTKVNITNKDITLTPVYIISEEPTFNVTVKTGEGGDGSSSGSGSYVAGDTVEISAAVPKDGYMFSHWENADESGFSTGISLDNEFYWSTSFEMTDRYASVCEKMFNNGTTLIFAGGNSKLESAYTAKYEFDSSPSVIASGTDHDDSYCAVIKNYGEAVKDCLAEFQGGGVAAASCATDGISVINLPEDNEELKSEVDAIYKSLGDGKTTPIRAEGGAGNEFCQAFAENKMSDCLSLNGWFKDVSVITVDAD